MDIGLIFLTLKTILFAFSRQKLISLESILSLNHFKTNANCITDFESIDSQSSYLGESQFEWWQPSAESLICSGGINGCSKTLIVDIDKVDVYTVYVHAGCG